MWTLFALESGDLGRNLRGIEEELGLTPKIFLEKDGKELEANEVMEEIPSSQEGHSIQNLKHIAANYGYTLTGLRISISKEDWGHTLVGFCQAQKSSLARKKEFFFVLSFLMITGILD